MRTADVPRSELSRRELGLAVQENLFDLFRAFERLPGAELEESGGFGRHHSFPSNPTFKGFWNCRLPPDRLDDAIDGSIRWFQERGAPFAFFWLGPDTEPEGLRERLERRGLAAWETDAPGMAAELAALDWEALERVPEEFRVEAVRTDEQLDAFARTFVTAFEVPEWAGAAWVDATRRVGIEEAPWQLYLGVLDGTPVATNILVPGGGVVGVLGVGTLSEARGRGIGAAITLAAYRYARELGYRYGVLFSTELGLPVYRRIGFEECGVSITRYLWRA